MKVAISLPDELAERIDTRARALKLTRSAFIARAAAAYLTKQTTDEEDVEAWNRVADEMAADPEEKRFSEILIRHNKRMIREATKNDKW